MEGIITILKHDLHKIKTKNYASHEDSLPDELMKQADSISSRISRNWMKFLNKKHSPHRRKYFSFKSNKINRINKITLQQEITKLFTETDPIKLHFNILESSALNMFSEAQDHPFTSLKYNLLLTCAFYYNLTRGFTWHQLYLHENPKKRSQFQVIYKDTNREWALVPDSGLSRVNLKFHDTWDRRLTTSIEDETLSNLLSRIASWSAALAIMEEYDQQRIELKKYLRNEINQSNRKMNERRAGSRARNDHQG